MGDTNIGRRGVLGGAGLLAVQPGVVRAAAGNPRVVMATGKGNIVMEMEVRKAPLSAKNFLQYVDAKLFDGGDIYRASRTPGEPSNGTIQGRPPGNIRRFAPVPHESTEKTGLMHDTGTVSLARYQPGTATCDFFICLGPQPFYDAHPDQPGDNKGYAVFGKVVSGMDVVRLIHGLPTGGKAAFPELKGQILTHPIPLISMRRA
jgi:peptidyl-prolyl cis-trans isomerase A (cyclophilin A)